MFQETLPNAQASAIPFKFALPPVTPALPFTTTLEARRSLALQGTFRAGNFRIQQGCIALHQSLGDGRRQILDILGPGRLLGPDLMSALACSAEPMTSTSIETLPAGPDTDADVLLALQLMLRRAQAHATLLGRKTAAEKVASALIDLAAQFAGPRQPASRRTMTFRLYLTRADLADWLGLTLETVSRTLNAFKRGHVIDFRHADIITISDAAALANLSAGELPRQSRTRER